MKKFVSALMIAAMLSTSGCATWWQNFKNDPVAQVQTIISTLETVITISSIIFGEVRPLLPETQRAEAQQKFVRAVMAVEAAKRSLRDALAISEAAKESPPNIGNSIKVALLAAENLRNLIRQFQALVAAPAGSVANSWVKGDDLDAAVEALRSFQK